MTLEYWLLFSVNCRTLLELYDMEPLKDRISHITFGKMTKRHFRAFQTISGPTCTVPLWRGRHRQIDIIGTRENLEIVQGLDTDSLPDYAQFVWEQYAEMFYRLSPGALADMKLAHQNRYQEGRIRHYIAKHFAELRITPEAADYQQNGPEVQLLEKSKNYQIPKNFACKCATNGL